MTAELTAGSLVYRHPAALVVEDTGDELLLHRPGIDSIFYLNGTAALVWHLCDGKRGMDEIICLLTAAYPEEADSVRAQVPEVLDNLLRNQVVEPVA